MDLLRRSPHWWYPIISSAYGVNLDNRKLDTILYIVEKSDVPLYLLQFVVSPFLQIRTVIDYCHSLGKSSLF